MFEKVHEVPLPHGTVSPWPSNLTVCWLDTRSTTYLAVIQGNNVHVGNWDNKSETELTWETIHTSDVAGNEQIVDVTTVGLVHPNARNFPVVVIGSTRCVYVYDVKKATSKPLFVIPLHQRKEKEEVPKHVGGDVGPYCRGISCNDNTVLVGTYTGEIIVLTCNGDSNFTTRKSLKEHKSAISEIATCRYEDVTVSADSQGEMIIWQKPVKGVSTRISTNQFVNVINVLRKQIIVGTLRGLIQYYSVATGDLMCEISAHSRPVSSISVAPESAYVLTASEDGTFIVSKLHTRKPHAYQVEYRFSDSDSSAAIVGAQFTNGRGSAIAVACYDSSVIALYKIVKKAVAAS